MRKTLKKTLGTIAFLGGVVTTIASCMLLLMYVNDIEKVVNKVKKAFGIFGRFLPRKDDIATLMEE